MMFVVSVLVSLVLATSVVGAMARQVKDAVVQFNLRQISEVMDADFIGDGVYPSSLDKLIRNHELQNVSSNKNYILSVSENGQKASVLGASTDKIYCWRSDTEEIAAVGDRNSCLP